jgi:ketopantoate hydroxymethyltransferase
MICLGLFNRYQPKFSKKYADLGPQIIKAVKQYKKEVTNSPIPRRRPFFSFIQG